MTSLRMVNYAALPVLLAAAWLGWNWPWGLLFLWWAVPSILGGQAFLVGEIRRDTDPVLFWIVTALWALFGVLMIAADLFPVFYATWLT